MGTAHRRYPINKQSNAAHSVVAIIVIVNVVATVIVSYTDHGIAAKLQRLLLTGHC